MVDGIGKYLDRATAVSVKKRTAHWKPDYATPQAFAKSLEPQRQRLRKILGVVDQRLPPAMAYVGTTDRPALLGDTKEYRIYAVRWPVLPGVHGEGLLFEPTDKPKACLVAIPDADQTPEMLAGLEKGPPLSTPFVAMMASRGVRVVIPTLIDRKDTWSGSAQLGRFTNQTHREFIYRMSYQMGRHIIGYEVQRVLATVDWLCQDKAHPPVGLWGYGEGGLLALYSAALDQRIDTTVVAGYFGARERLAEEPIYRNVWTLLRDFGDAELAQLIFPRRMRVEISDFDAGPAPPARAGRGGAAPGTAKTADRADIVLGEFNRIPLVLPRTPFGAALSDTLQTPALAGRLETAEVLTAELFRKDRIELRPVAPPKVLSYDPQPRQKRQVEELVAYTQHLLPEAAAKRDEFFWKKLDTSSPEKFKKSQEPLRDYFAKEIIGELPKSTKPLNPRTRQIYDTPKFTGYEVVLDLYDDVICYGILLVPKDIKPGEKRPVVVCQHGLEGRPTDVCDPFKKTQYYNSFGAQLAERGFVVFAPQNPYIFKNDFRQLVRKANPLGLTLYAFIVQQHERILDFLTSLPFVDASRIAYYGLSYGGKVAMRIPVLVGRYCVVICSGDFNEWIWKNITLDWVNSYMFGGEYEMYEFDLGNTFNYAEMAALIAPRPFMVERGHHDPVGLDEYVAFEYAKVRRFYARLGMPERTEIEWFNGGHVINGQATFAFLHRHLNWPAR
jgi:cephalosporin-C deacetylase-like acetyl esterase